MRPLVIGIGELLWDVLPSGPRMGGAPANFACHAQALGASGAVISSVGADDLGERLLFNLNELGVSTAGLWKDGEAPTGTVDVALGRDGQPHFTIRDRVAWDRIVVHAPALQMMSQASAVCFGTLSQRAESSRQSIRELLRATRPAALRVFDANLRQHFYSRELIHESLGLANVMKLSDSELPVVAELLGLHGSVHEQLAALRERYGLRMIAYTRGAHGSLLWDGSEWSEHPGLPTQVKDTIGAGDSFTAAATLGLLQGWPLEEISATANAVAAHVCSCEGAIPPMPAVLRERFRWSSPAETAPEPDALSFEFLKPA